MMVWLIHVPDEMYYDFYRLLYKEGKIDDVVCLDRHMQNRKYVTMFIGKFEIPFAEMLEEKLRVVCLIFGPAELWKKALSTKSPLL